MSKHDIKVLGKNKEVSGKMFCLIVVFCIVFGTFFLFSAYAGIWNFGEKYLGSGLISMLTVFALFTSTKFNNKRIGVLPDTQTTKAISAFVYWFAFFYYWLS